MSSSTIPLSAWGGLGVIAIGLVVMWLMPSARLMVGTGLVVGGAFLTVLIVLRRRVTTPDEHDEAAPLHLRD